MHKNLQHDNTFYTHCSINIQIYLRAVLHIHVPSYTVLYSLIIVPIHLNLALTAFTSREVVLLREI